jgi:hypothetical protein
MKYAVGMGSGVMKCVSEFRKIGLGIQKLLGRMCIQTDSNVIS